MASKKKKVRGGYHSHAKKIFTECDTVVKKANPPKAQVERLCAILRDTLTVLKAIDEEIFFLINPDEIENEAGESEDWRVEIQSRLTQLEAKISVAPVHSGPRGGNLDKNDYRRIKMKFIFLKTRKIF